ncbi:MAG TPA: hypothetical protein PLB36_04900 [Bacillota bacterium]|nr:hypothetical protein [Candidatus Fermentithermobacillaceae bacterium]HOB30866.1 hypothetical protein [Bacillota bacterium]HOK64663.1 hypothetical protein [Bacillota bacterium]HOL12206.1 hypothetical protein [Bacillota bacterium]HOQ02244.1 hypothetical protein [Bacillota bacterium]
MSKFLRAGILRDRLSDIVEASRMLQEALDSGEEGPRRCKELAMDIESMANEIIDFMSYWNCEPLIYLGEGTTDEVIGFLDKLIYEAEAGKGKDSES